MVYALRLTRKYISSPKGKFLTEQFSAIFFLVALFVYEVLDNHHPVLFSFLLSWILGSLASELIQLRIYGPRRYFENIWTILDLLVLISFAAGVILRDYFIMSGSHFLLFFEKLPALTLVCAMLRRMQNFYLSELVGKMFLIFMEMKTEVYRFLVIFGYVVLAFACSFYFLYYDVRDGIFRPFLSFHTSLLHLTMKVFSETNNIEYLQLLNQNITIGAAQRNGTIAFDASGIYDFVGFTLYTIFLMMAILILLKLCVAMMTNKYSILQKNIEKLWYLKRSEIWLYYIRQKIIFPPPYNLLEIFVRILLDLKRRFQQAVCEANASGEPVQDEHQWRTGQRSQDRNDEEERWTRRFRAIVRRE
ncbi:short transient receptor potential channel 4-like isoform X1 [Ptychodera flava]